MSPPIHRCSPPPCISGSSQPSVSCIISCTLMAFLNLPGYCVSLSVSPQPFQWRCKS
ncbi:hypothetical protein HOLleu_17264 [Holothuria leucospilota]|uniref:Uncharacterized protein n=1 Tax=Holothuria leucospilota TaxID=206669 RepID=A0A9Q1C7X3_HOLLE|nr:hypothetical protein HOLleu_17264 [Holothuria leucospilota]